MKKREPNFENLKKVLARQVPDRPVLFEFTLNMPHYVPFENYMAMVKAAVCIAGRSAG